jgi:hypothetical protein
MDQTAKDLRDRIALYRKLLAEVDIGVNLTRHYLNEIVLAQMQQRHLGSHENERSRSTR